MKYLIALLIITFIVACGIGQEGSFKVTTSPSQVEVGDLVKIKFSVVNIKGDIDVKDWDESLQYYSQPSISNRTSIINDVISQSQEYIFTVRASEKGSFPITGEFKLYSTGEIIFCHGQVEVVDDVPNKTDDLIEEDMQFKRQDPRVLPKASSKKKRKIYKL